MNAREQVTVLLGQGKTIDEIRQATGLSPRFIGGIKGYLASPMRKIEGLRKTEGLILEGRPVSTPLYRVKLEAEVTDPNLILPKNIKIMHLEVVEIGWPRRGRPRKKA